MADDPYLKLARSFAPDPEHDVLVVLLGAIAARRSLHLRVAARDPFASARTGETVNDLTVAQIRERLAEAERAIRAEVAYELSLLHMEGIHPTGINIEFARVEPVGGKPTHVLAGVSIKVEL